MSNQNSAGAYAPLHDPARTPLTLRFGGDGLLYLPGDAMPCDWDLADIARTRKESWSAVEELSEISDLVAEQQQGCADDSALLSSLDFTKAAFPKRHAKMRDLLSDLQLKGENLHKQLPKELCDKVLRRSAGADGVVTLDQPLTFFDFKSPPFLWDICYDGDAKEPLDHHSFWGLRFPITSWFWREISSKIQLGERIFSAVNEGLSFAGNEVRMLHQRSGATPKTLKTLDESLRHYTWSWLKNEKRPDEAEQLRSDGDDWLKTFLDALYAKEGKNGPKRWNSGAMSDLFDDPTLYDLMHFACHCEPSPDESFSRLLLTVGGVDVSIDVASLRREGAASRRKLTPGVGPVVFLNACGSGGTTGTYEPGLPRAWIKDHSAKAVIATVCPVPDGFAYAFANTFYRQLFDTFDRNDGWAVPPSAQKRYLSDTLLATKRWFMEKYDNPLGLAYVLFAHNTTFVEPPAIESVSTQ
ncbi:CHAT domain-containing protein [Chloroflexales bacterium ZM16-3]|nr:CHAT domain-containing protein [Chloroflexales bacterium ZM16-3]